MLVATAIQRGVRLFTPPHFVLRRENNIPAVLSSMHIPLLLFYIYYYYYLIIVVIIISYMHMSLMPTDLP